jgi:hypothetical protein
MQPAPAPDRVVSTFRADGCAFLGQVLAPAEVEEWRRRFAEDRERHRVCWRFAGADIVNNVDILVSMPEIDGLIRHPRILAALRAIMGSEPRFWETSARHLAPLGARTHPAHWHRDFGPRETVIQAFFLFTDVTPDTHCLTIVPRALDAPLRPFDAEFAERGERECLGPAGSVWLFDPNCFHTARQRGDAERTTLHTYYGCEARPITPVASGWSTVPARLWRDGDDAARAFYEFAPHGMRTAMMAAAFG